MKALKILIVVVVVSFVGSLLYVAVRGPTQPRAAGSVTASGDSGATSTVATTAVARPAAAATLAPTVAPTIVPTAVPSQTPTELERVATEAGVDPAELKAAVAATGLSPREYLQSTGELPMPTPTAKPEATPAPTRVPVVTAAFTGSFNPRAVAVGGKQVFTLQVTNDGNTDIEGLHVSSNGPWGKYTVTGLSPEGTFDDVFGLRLFAWPQRVRPGQSTTLNIVTFPNEPGNYDFTFRLRDGQDHLLKTAQGDDAALGGKVAVTR